ncbi:MAG: DUF3313 family protein [Verrucomicrobiota bacterium]
MKSVRFPALARRGLFILLASLLASCSHLKPTKTGFLTNYDRLQEDPGNRDRLYYQNLQTRNAISRPVHIAPVVYRPTDIEGTPPSEDSIVRLKAYFDRAMIEEFREAGFRLVREPVSGSLHVKSAITAFNTTRPVLNTVTTIIAVPVDNGGVSVETEILDPANGEVVYAEAASTRGGPLQGKFGRQMVGYFQRHGHAETGLRIIAERTAAALAAR